MNLSVNVVVGVIVSYFLGSISFALLAGKLRGVDVRAHGSGNLGATNAGRVLGRPVGFAIFALDFLKGVVPALWFPAIVLARGNAPGFDRMSLGLLFGASAMAGHVFPFYLRFKGGKGVATGAGVFLALAPIATLVALAAWAITLFLSRYVSLASVVAAIVLPLAILGLGALADGAGRERLLVAAAIAVAGLIVLRHRANIRRILHGTEKRIGGGA